MRILETQGENDIKMNLRNFSSSYTLKF